MHTPSPPPQYKIGFACDVGRKRRNELNQDALEVVTSDNHRHPPLLLVADGLGKHFGGAIASQLVIRAFKEEFLSAPHPTDYLALLERCARKAHEAVRSRGASDPQLANMGSTLVAAVLEEHTLHLLNIGDSRAYLLRGKNILQVSRDQSWVALQVQAGLLTAEEARTHPNRNRLNMAITAKRPEIKPYLTRKTLQPEDILVLCSDGLWGVVPETLIWAAATELPPDIAVKKLISLANRQQGPDNISVIIARRFQPDREAVPAKLADTTP